MREGRSRLHARQLEEISECIEKVSGDIYCSRSLIYITTGLDGIRINEG